MYAPGEATVIRHGWLPACLPVGECGGGGAVADGDEVPELRGLGHRRAHRRAARQHDHLLRPVVEQVVHHGRTLPGVALQ